MQDIWRRIEAWLSTHAPEVLSKLGEGAQSEDIQHLEMDLGYALPEPLRVSLSIHNGAPDFVDAWNLLDLRSMREAHQEQDEVRHWLQETNDLPLWWWRPHWLPFATDGGGNLLCVELAPSGAIPQGQVILFDHETGSGPAAQSFQLFLSGLADAFEAGDYAIDQWGTLCSVVPWEKRLTSRTD